MSATQFTITDMLAATAVVAAVCGSAMVAVQPLLGSLGPAGSSHSPSTFGSDYEAFRSSSALLLGLVYVWLVVGSWVLAPVAAVVFLIARRKWLVVGILAGILGAVSSWFVVADLLAGRPDWNIFWILTAAVTILLLDRLFTLLRLRYDFVRVRAPLAKDTKPVRVVDPWQNQGISM